MSVIAPSFSKPHFPLLYSGTHSFPCGSVGGLKDIITLHFSFDFEGRLELAMVMISLTDQRWPEHYRRLCHVARGVISHHRLLAVSPSIESLVPEPSTVTCVCVQTSVQHGNVPSK